MLTLNAVAALILLFVLLPVAKLTRRLVYTLLEQIDHGDVHEHGKGSFSRAKGSIASAGFVASAAWREAKRGDGKGRGGKTKTPTPNRGGSNGGGSGRSAHKQDSKTVGGGYLPEKSVGTFSQSERAVGSTQRNETLRTSDSNLNHRSAASFSARGMEKERSSVHHIEGNRSVIPDKEAPSRMWQRQGKQTPPGSNQSRLSSRKGQSSRSAAIKGKRIGGKWMGHAGAAVSTAAGIGASAVFGPLAGRTLATKGTKMFRHSGQLAGAATGASVKGSRRMYEHVRQRKAKAHPTHQGVSPRSLGLPRSYRLMKDTTGFANQSIPTKPREGSFVKEKRAQGNTGNLSSPAPKLTNPPSFKASNTKSKHHFTSPPSSKPRFPSDDK
ncbi:MAG TPA: hypothetical protein VF199_14135 [Bacillales bacterium]